jgi:hypothetical protein
MFEQATSPAGGLWQTRQPSVHSMHAGSGGTKMLAAGGAGGGRAGGAAGGGTSVPDAAADQSATAIANRTQRAERFMAESLPSPRRQVEPA